MAEFFRVLKLEEARRLLTEALPNPFSQGEEVPLEEAQGRIVAQDLVCEEMLPAFPRSSVDGLAVRARDTFGAGEGSPILLQVAGEVEMGQVPDGTVGPNQAMRVPTGGMIPEGADAMVMVEYTEYLDDTTVVVQRAAAPGDHILRPGEDVNPGQLLFARGHRLRPADVGLLAALGKTPVPVVKKPRLAILSTGDEVVDPTQKPEGAQIRDVNSYALAALVREAGGIPILAGRVPDDFARYRDRLADALASADGVLLSGGSSVGVRDLTLRILESFEGCRILFHGLHIKPGKPTLCAVIDGKPVFGLPGHPASALVVFHVLFKGWLAPTAESYFDRLKARVNRNIPSGAGREEFVPVTLEWAAEGWQAEPLFGKSGLLTPLTKADGLMHIPLSKEGVALGEWVDVIRL